MPNGKQSCDAGELRTRMIPSQPCDGARRATLFFDLNEVLMAAKLKQPDGSKLRLRNPILRPGLDKLNELKASVFQHKVNQWICKRCSAEPGHRFAFERAK